VVLGMMRENDARTRTPGARPYVVSAEAPASRRSVRRVSDFGTASFDERSFLFDRI
jgi:hypothetical protein